MSDIPENLSTLNSYTAPEEFREQVLPVQPDYTAGLEPVEYPSFTIYLGEPSEAQRLRQRKGRYPGQQGGRYLQPEIKYVKSDGYEFLVDSLSLVPDYFTKAQTMSCIWGALGKTQKTTAEELGVSFATINTHRADMLKKIGASSMVNGVKLAFDRKIFIPSPNKVHADLKLTPKEYVVLEALSRDSDVERRGKELFITPATVRTHTRNIISKNRVENFAHAVTLACLAGQLPLAE